MIIEIVGWAGAALVLLAYFLVSFGKLKGESVTFQLLNILGVIGLGINVFVHRAWPNFVLNIAWGLIGVFALFKIRKIRKNKL